EAPLPRTVQEQHNGIAAVRFDRLRSEQPIANLPAGRAVDPADGHDLFLEPVDAGERHPVCLCPEPPLPPFEAGPDDRVRGRPEEDAAAPAADREVAVGHRPCPFPALRPLKAITSATTPATASADSQNESSAARTNRR